MTSEEETKLRSEAEVESLKYNHDGKVIIFIDYFLDQDEEVEAKYDEETEEEVVDKPPEP